MKPAFKILTFILLVTTLALLMPVIKNWNYQYDQHGFYTGPDGIVHREWESEKNFFLFLLSGALLLISAFISYRNPTRYQPK